MFMFIGENDSRPVRLVLTFSRGTSDREGHVYAAECTAHLLIDSAWTHLGPGRYEGRETTLTVIPETAGPGIQKSADSLAYRIDFADRVRPFQLAVHCLDFMFDATADSNYSIRYDTGPGVLFIDTDTIPGTIIHCRQDFTGYNRLAGNVRGHFPGKYELVALAASRGAVFLFAADPVARNDSDVRVRTDFAACRLPDGETLAVLDSVEITWPVADDSLYPGKPIPREWKIEVANHLWQARVVDRGHFFYFTGFGLFAVGGTVEFRGARYDVAGIVEHIHARNEPR